MKFIVVLIFSFCLLEAVLSLSQQEEEIINKFILNTYMPLNNIPGLIVTIVENDTVVMAKGFGLKSVEQGTPADGNTLMGIGSNTKGMTGVIVAKTLHEMFPELGSAVLDTPIQKLMPNRNITFSDRYRSEMMTFRDLLSHRSCLINTLDLAVTFNSVATIEEKIYRSRYQPEICQFRNGLAYNDGLISLAGELVAEIKGIPYTQLLLEFMREIGMETATFFDKDGEFEKLPNMSSGYYSKANETETHLYNPKLLRRIHTAVGAGGVMASANDMGAYMRFHMNRGRVGDRQVMPQEVLDWIYKIANAEGVELVGKIPNGMDAVYGYYGYSLGFMHQIIDGWKSVSHAGYWPPFNSAVAIYPDLKHAVFIASNGPSYIGNPTGFLSHPVLGLLIFSLLQEISIPITSVPLMNPHNLNVDQWIPEPKLENEALQGMKRRDGGDIYELIGSYGNPLHGEMVIGFDLEDERNETLEMRLGEFGIGRLIPRPDEPLLFDIQWKTDIEQFFHTLSLGVYAEYASVLDMSYGGAVVYLTQIFIKDQNLETYPPIPWAPDSCAAPTAR